MKFIYHDHENNLITSLSDSTKYDIVVILVFFSELFDGYPIRRSVRKVFYSFLVEEPPVVPRTA